MRNASLDITNATTTDAEVKKITIGAAVEGETYSATFGFGVASYVALAGNTTSDIAAALETDITSVAGSVVTAVDTTNTILLTMKRAGVPMDVGVDGPSTSIETVTPAAVAAEVDLTALGFNAVAVGATNHETVDLDNVTDELIRQLEGIEARGDVTMAPTLRDLMNGLGLADSQARWAANHVDVGWVLANPTTPSIVSVRTVNVIDGEAMVDGSYFTVATATDVAPDAEIDAAGADVSAVNLTASMDSYSHAVLVNNSGIEMVFIRGAEATTGNAVPLSEDDIAVAVGIYLSAPGRYYGYVRIADILFEEAAGLTQTTTALRPVPEWQ